MRPSAGHLHTLNSVLKSIPEPPSKDVYRKLSPKGAGSSASTGSAAFLACDSFIEGYGAILTFVSGAAWRMHDLFTSKSRTTTEIAASAILTSFTGVR